jgi:hypothetical protein
MIISGLNGISAVLNIFSQEGVGIIVYALILTFYVLAIKKIYTDSFPIRDGGDVTG